MLTIKSPAEDIVYNIDKISFKGDKTDNKFILESSSNPDIYFTVPYHLPVDMEYKNDNFDCVPFISPLYFKENNIFEVHVNNASIGYPLHQPHHLLFNKVV